MFKEARLKLTVWYLLILMSVTIFFSFTIHSLLLGQVKAFVVEQRFRIERRFGPIQPSDSLDTDFVENANRRIVFTLLTINSAILFVAGGLGYFLAGKTLDPIKNMLEDQNRFITDSSHELRTPLTSLKLAMEVALRDTGLTIKEAKVLISENILEVNHLQELSNRLLHLTSGKKLGPPLEVERLSIQKIIGESIKNISVMAKNKGLILKNLVSTEQEIVGNRDELKELFNILLENAVKYSHHKGSVVINSIVRKKSIEVSIKDEGIGIDAKDLPHIFDRFFRGDTARSKGEIDGFGLGLSIAKKIVEDHHGSISVQSKIDQGTTFIIHLPV